MSGRRDQHEERAGRTEPTLGDFDPVNPAAPPIDPPPPDWLPAETLPPVRVDPGHRHAASARTHRRPPPRRWPWLLALALLVLGGLLAVWLSQDRLRGMVPRTGLNDMLTRADMALKDGRLDGHDGTSARELYEAAYALEPDNDHARSGLRQVGMAELSEADAALQAGHLDQAEQTLGVARELLGGGNDVDRLEQSITKARGAAVPTEDLVGEAQQALADGKLTGPDGAGALYQRVLAADPDNAVAAHGLDNVGAALADQASHALAGDDTTTAAARIDQLAALLPNYGELPSLRAALVQAQTKQGGALTDALKHGDEALRAGHISGAGDSTALAYFQQALTLDPQNQQARAGLGQVAQALVVQANAALDSNDGEQARQLLDEAAKLAPKSADLAAAQARLHEAPAAGRETPADHAAPVASQAARPPEASEPADDNPPPPPPVTPEQSAEVARLVARARTAATRGQIMMPPGESAYDLYRNALAIDGNNLAARQGLQDLPNVVSHQLDQAIASGQLSQATDLAGELADLAPGDAGQLGLRQRLGDAWLDQAEQQLNRGDRTGAAQSLQQARKLAPEQTRVQAIAGRLQAGR
jgi:tetratricopeptide (TPR) repeat protein